LEYTKSYGVPENEDGNKLNNRTTAFKLRLVSIKIAFTSRGNSQATRTAEIREALTSTMAPAASVSTGEMSSRSRLGNRIKAHGAA